jgi:DNA adenine methylase
LRFSVPHPIPYQGSKRRLAQAILSHIASGRYERLVEPFVGSGAVTLAAAKCERFRRFWLGDKLEPLASLWARIVENPEPIADEYEDLWHRERRRPIDGYYEIRSEFNSDRSSAKLLYLLARCVKNAVRFNPSGEFNQSPDKRRAGTRPETMRKELVGAHRLLYGRTEVSCADFLELFRNSGPDDFFYLDPPYQGTSDGRDSRYIDGVTRSRIIEGLGVLNERGTPFILSYDGSCGERTYGDRLPADLASRVQLDVGRSSQATLNGEDCVTIESLYISHQLVPVMRDDAVVSLREFEGPRVVTESLF